MCSLDAYSRSMPLSKGNSSSSSMQESARAPVVVVHSSSSSTAQQDTAGSQATSVQVNSGANAAHTGIKGKVTSIFGSNSNNSGDNAFGANKTIHDKSSLSTRQPAAPAKDTGNALNQARTTASVPTAAGPSRTKTLNSEVGAAKTAPLAPGWSEHVRNPSFCNSIQYWRNCILFWSVSNGAIYCFILSFDACYCMCNMLVCLNKRVLGFVKYRSVSSLVFLRLLLELHSCLH
jgi:hypothetical protein